MQPRFVESSLLDRRADGAAWLRFMRTVREPAVTGQAGDLGKYVVERRPDIDKLQLSHTR